LVSIFFTFAFKKANIYHKKNRINGSSILSEVQDGEDQVTQFTTKFIYLGVTQFYYFNSISIEKPKISSYKSKILNFL